MKCIFRTNPVQRVQDDYVWYRLAGNEWVMGPNSGNTPDVQLAQTLARAFSTIRVGSSYLVLMREQDNGSLVLAVGVYTQRREIGQHHRPIDDTMYLLAENKEDEAVLCGFAEACFATDDAQGLGNPASEPSSSIDEIWKSCSLQNFVAKYRTGLGAGNNSESLDESWIYPRMDMESRRDASTKLSQWVLSRQVFLAVLCDRSPCEAINSLSGFVGNYYAFSTRIVKAEKVVRPDFPNTPFRPRRTGIMIVVAVLFVMLALAIVAICRTARHLPIGNELDLNSATNSAVLQKKN